MQSVPSSSILLQGCSKGLAQCVSCTVGDYKTIIEIHLPISYGFLSHLTLWHCSLYTIFLRTFLSLHASLQFPTRILLFYILQPSLSWFPSPCIVHPCIVLRVMSPIPLSLIYSPFSFSIRPSPQLVRIF